MHFSKTYSQLLLTLPPDLRQNAIEYRQLKKLINQTVLELASLGLSPDVLQQILQQTQSSKAASEDASDTHVRDRALLDLPSQDHPLLPKGVTYEIDTSDSDKIIPRLRLSYSDDGSPCVLLTHSSPHPSISALNDIPHPPQISPDAVDCSSSGVEELQEIQHATVHDVNEHQHDHELVVPLASDSAFFQSLLHAHHSLGVYLVTLRDEMIHNIDDLSRLISTSAVPMSAQTTFEPYSRTSNPSAISIPTHSNFFNITKSDLYAWREILQIYMDADIFVSHTEEARGERAVQDAEERFTKFMNLLEERDYASGRALRLKHSKEAMMKFLQLNASILNLVKFQYATTEAIRKILKKHTKRTALPFTITIPSPFLVANLPLFLQTSQSTSSSSLIKAPNSSTTTLATFIVQAIGERVLPIVPHLDDYSCVICTAIAFKPIRLQCGHLFCVRCLVKMQKRGQGNCPFCRAPTVLIADRSNVDWALLNFMKDWFPMESKRKLRQNEREAAQEEMQELGLNAQGCVIA